MVMQRDEIQPAPGPKGSLDILLALGLTAVGVALLAAALQQSALALNLYAGLDGAVITVILAAVLATLDGMRPRLVLALLAPILLGEIAVLIALRIPVLGPLGLEATVVGVFLMVAAKARRWYARALER